MRYYPSFPMVIPLYEAGYLRVTHPFATNHRNDSFHLHVLGMPPAFILSQDQTLLFFYYTKYPWILYSFFFLAQIDVIVYISSLILFFLILFSFQKSFRTFFFFFHRRLYIISLYIFYVNIFFSFFYFFSSFYFFKKYRVFLWFYSI